MNRRRRVVPATELRVHLGEALKALGEEDLVVEKGGVPVALVTRYPGEAPEAESVSEMNATYTAALSKRANPRGWPRAMAAMERGWAGVEAGAFAEAVYAAREEGATPRVFSIDEDEEDAGDGSLPAGQRRLHSRPRQTQRVAEERDRPYTV